VAINAITPIGVLILVAAANFDPLYQSRIVCLTVLFMLLANIAAMVRHKVMRWPFGVMLVLNPLALLVLGAVSFITAIPDMPLLFKSLYLLVLENQ